MSLYILIVFVIWSVILLCLNVFTDMESLAGDSIGFLIMFFMLICNSIAFIIEKFKEKRK